MISPAGIKDRALKIWQSGRLFAAYLRGEEIFPLDIPFRKVTAKEALERYAEVRAWVNLLRDGSKERQGYGYTLEFAPVSHRQLGEQLFPARIVFDSLPDLLRFIGKGRDFDRFRELAQQTLAEYPALRPWLERYPFKALENHSVWPQLRLVCRYFRQHPAPQRYLRELDIPGVDSKFVEQNKGVLRELLDLLLPPETICQEVTALSGAGFERRFGLRHDEPLLRFRLLDPELAGPWGLSDLSIPLGQFLVLGPPCAQVFITENKINGLSFPPVPGSLVIFGLGYGIQTLREVEWLRRKKLYYWGDIDTHGFAILSQIRGYFPQIRSLLMDRETLLAYRDLWTTEETEKRCLAELSNLDGEERRLYEDLRNNRLGENIRLEQERIALSRLRDWLAGHGSGVCP
jgi:hypothetical protein